MVKRALLILSLISSTVYGATYQINVVKEELSPHREKKFVIYKVKRGDTLLKIMNKFKIPERFLYKIVKLNGIKNPNIIYVGQVIRLPVGKSFSPKNIPNSSRKRTANVERELILLERLGARINRNGYFFVGDKKIPLRKNPLVSVGNRNYMIDFTGFSEDIKSKLSEAGVSVVKKNEIDRLIEEAISANFSSLQRNGTLILGEKDVLTYHYDYLAYNRFTGQRTVINKTPDTPPPLKNLLGSYGVAVIEPKYRLPDDGEGWGTVKVLTGSGLDKIYQLIFLLTGERGKTIPEGMVFPDSQLAVVYDYITPERRAKLELQGYKVFILTGNFLNDIENILSLIPLANKFVKLVLYEPPGTKGKRAKFVIDGLLISTEKRDWFLIDSVDKPEEIPYLRYRGVNLVIY